MPTYVIVHNERRGEDVRLEDDHLTVDFTPHWVTFHDANGPCYAVPREQVACIMRVDEPHDGPAPEG
ncbi:hypothetical protein ABZZ74_23310 [Streptomyces sp. NPDC006476]|uniref:hypothetical protein n=1 Tax=Streptomyces sp. NPDC006476 TaxID=3157175 RepID=UPI0033AEFF3E